MKVYIKFIAVNHTYTMTLNVSDYDTEKNSHISLINWLKNNSGKFVRWQFTSHGSESYGHRIRIEELMFTHF